MSKKILFSQNAFNTGEVSPRLYSRQDTEKYSSGLKTATNCILTPHGPAHRRNGSKFIREVKTSANQTYLFKYEFDTDESYIIEAGNLYFRFYKDGAVLGAPYEVTTPYTTAQLPDVTYIQSGRNIYFAHSSHSPRVLTRRGDTDWLFETTTFSPPPTYESGHEPDTTLTPGATTGTGVTFTAGSANFVKADVGRQILNNTDGETGRAIIVGYTSTTVVTADIVEDFTDTNPIASGDWALDLSPIAALTPDSIQLGSVTNITADELGTSTTALATFRSGDVGRYIYLNTGVVKIIEYVSASEINAEVVKVLNSTDETEVWSMETDTWDATRGYPATVGLYQSRLVFAATEAQPTTMWMSEVDIFNGFGFGSEDDDAIELTLSSRDTNKITWMSNSRDLIVGTTGAELTIDDSGATSFTSATARAVSRTYHGGLTHTPIQIANETIFIQSSQLKLRSFRYDFNIDGYIGEDLTFISEHITEEKISRIAYAQEPNRIIYAVLENGDMLAGSYMREQKVLGWAKFTTDGEYEDVQVISNGSVDEVWVVVKRTINGSDVRYIELFDTGNGEDRLDGFSDSFLTYSDPKTITAATKADPGVITAASHGYSDGDDVRIIDVGGMTELNNNTYIVANKTTNTFELESNDARTSIVNSTYKWTASGSGTDEYYVELAAGGDPSMSSSIITTYQDDNRMVAGTAGSLAAGEWDYADNDTLGYSTIYVRLTGGEDPDDKGQGWVEYALGVDTSAFTTYTSGGEVHALVETISGLDHLEGETVQIKTDGAVHDDKVVSSGSITLDSSAFEVTVGISYTTTIETLEASFDIGLGEMQGQVTRWIKPKVRVYKSALPLLNGTVLPSRNPDDLLDQPVPLFTGDIDYSQQTYEEGSVLLFTLSDPLPLQLGGIFGSLAGGVL